MSRLGPLSDPCLCDNNSKQCPFLSSIPLRRDISCYPVEKGQIVELRNVFPMKHRLRKFGCIQDNSCIRALHHLLGWLHMSTYVGSLINSRTYGVFDFNSLSILRTI